MKWEPIKLTVIRNFSSCQLLCEKITQKFVLLTMWKVCILKNKKLDYRTFWIESKNKNVLNRKVSSHGYFQVILIIYVYEAYSIFYFVYIYWYILVV